MATTDSFSEELTLDIKWRAKEFLNVREAISKFSTELENYNGMILRKEFTEEHRQEKDRIVDELLFFCRMSLPLIYAHWEGFFKHSLRAYLKHISTSEVNLSELTCEIIAYKLDAFMKKLQGKASFTHKKEFVSEYAEKMSSIAKFSKGELKVDTRSNLNYEVVNELCEKFVLDIKQFSPHESIIDRLVNQRNSICHGENSNVVNSAQIIEYLDVVMELFEVIHTQLCQKVAARDFLKERAA